MADQPDSRMQSQNQGQSQSQDQNQDDVLAFLAQNANCVVTRAQITQRVWGRVGTDETEALRVHVSHIRRKIEAAPGDQRFIVTEPGVGYRFSVPE